MCEYVHYFHELLKVNKITYMNYIYHIEKRMYIWVGEFLVIIQTVVNATCRFIALLTVVGISITSH